MFGNLEDEVVVESSIDVFRKTWFRYPVERLVGSYWPFVYPTVCELVQKQCRFPIIRNIS